MYLYCMYDKVAEHYSHFMLANSDGMYVREMIAHRVSYPLNFDDCVCLCLGSLDFGNFSVQFGENDFDLDTSSAHEVSWSSWQSPESVAQLLAPLGLDTQTTIDIARKRIETQIAEYRSKNEPVPEWLSDELKLYVNER